MRTKLKKRIRCIAHSMRITYHEPEKKNKRARKFLRARCVEVRMCPLKTIYAASAFTREDRRDNFRETVFG